MILKKVATPETVEWCRQLCSSGNTPPREYVEQLINLIDQQRKSVATLMEQLQNQWRLSI